MYACEHHASDLEFGPRSFTNYYVHCGTAWDGKWSAMCSDHCPICGAEIEPYASMDNEDGSVALHVSGVLGWRPEGGFPGGLARNEELPAWPGASHAC